MMAQVVQASSTYLGLGVVDWLSTLGLVLTIIAMVLAIAQGRQSKTQLIRAEEQTEKLEAQSKALQFVTASLTTRYLGPFPEFYEKVLEVLRAAKNDIFILNSNPVPAMITDPNIYVDYTHTLAIKAQQGLDIHVTCPTRKRRHARLLVEFPEDPDKWEEFKLEHREIVAPFVTRRMHNISFDDVSGTQFIDALLAAQELAYDEHYRRHGIVLNETDELFPVQAWISDGREAVFSIQRMNGSISHALYTSDPMFVEALSAMLVMYWPQTEDG